MVRGEIVEGLRFAMNKGDSLLKAMMSFYNAGYSKLEVEEAARMLGQPSLQNIQPQVQIQAPQPPPSQVQSQPKQYVSQYGVQQPTTVPLQNISEAPPTPIPGSPQIVSGYGGKVKHPLSTGVMIFLSITLFFLLSALVALVVFKDVIAKFFGGFL